MLLAWRYAVAGNLQNRKKKCTQIKSMQVLYVFVVF